MTGEGPAAGSNGLANRVVVRKPLHFDDCRATKAEALLDRLSK